MQQHTINIPELDQSLLGNRNTVRDNTQRGEEIVKIELNKIFIRENFNVREDYGDLQGLANSILNNGQSSPGRVDVLEDGTFVLVDGHRRYKALLILQDQGHEPLFKAIVNNSKTTEEQRILQMFTTQDNKQLQPVEVAELIQRLVNLGHKPAAIAVKIGKTPAYISQMLSFASESPVVKDEVRKGNISVSAVLKVKKDIPVQSERNEAVKNSVKQKEESKSSKSLTAKQVTGKDEKIVRAAKIATAVAKKFDIADNHVDALAKFIKTFL